MYIYTHRQTDMHCDVYMHKYKIRNMGWLRLVGFLKLQVSFAEYSLFYRSSFAKETYNLKEPTNTRYEVATITRLLKIVVLFCKRECIKETNSCKRNL